MINSSVDQIGQVDPNLYDHEVNDIKDAENTIQELNKDLKEIKGKDGLKRKRQKDNIREMQIKEDIRIRNKKLQDNN